MRADGEKALFGLHEAIDDDVRDAFKHLETEVVVLFAHFAEARPIEEHDFGGLNGAGIEMKIIGREKPRPTENVPCPDGLDEGAFALRLRLNGDFSFEDEVKAIGWIAFAKDGVAGIEAGAHGTFGEGFEVAFVEAAQERMLGYFSQHCWDLFHEANLRRQG